MRFFRDMKIRTQITSFAVLLLLAVLLFTIFFFTTFGALINQQNLQHFEAGRTAARQEISNTLLSIQQQLSGLDGDKSLQNFCFAESPWDAYIYGTAIQNNISGAVSLIEPLKAIAIDFKTENTILHGKTLDQAGYMRILDEITRLDREGRAFPALTTDDAGQYYLIFKQPLSAYSLAYKQMQSVANAYAVVQADALMPAATPEHGSILISGLSDPPEILAASNPALARQLLHAPLSLEQDRAQTINLRNINYLCGVSVLSPGIAYISVQTSASIEAGSQSIMMTAYIFLILLLLFCVWAVLHINRRIAVPMRRIEQDLSRVSSGDLSCRLADLSRDEFGQIVSSVNLLLDEIESRTKDNALAQQRLHDLEILRKNSELIALRCQINPHFLYNTLECVRSIASCYHAGAVNKIVSELIGIFRYCTAGDNYATVEEELACCRHYSEIIQIRFDGKYPFVYTVDERILHCRIPKMTLQPIVENAVYHGLEGKRDPGSVHIACAVEKNHAVVRVHDTGVGIPPETLHKMRTMLRTAPVSSQASGGIGLVNVHQRFVNEYGADYGIAVESVFGESTTVSLHIPLL